MAYKKTDIERTREYLKRYLTINNPRYIAEPEVHSIVNNFNLEFVKLYNRSMEALLAEELKAGTVTIDIRAINLTLVAKGQR